ncbi:MAG: YwbE family protein [Methanothrix sp.]|nr:YwbE family protein [Methanothrix sp.]
MSAAKSGQHRKDIRPGITVDVVLKKDQRTGKRTGGGDHRLAFYLTSTLLMDHGKGSSRRPYPLQD